MKDLIRLGLTSSKSIIRSAAVVAGVALGACSDYTCQDTATCPLLPEDAGTNSTGPGDIREGSADDGGSVTSGQHDDSTQRDVETDQTNDRSPDHTEDETSTEADASIPSQGNTETVDDATTLEPAVATSGELDVDADVANTATTDVDEDTDVPAPRRCSQDAPFGRPFPVASINLAKEIETVAVSPDGLTAYIRYGAEPTMYKSTRDAVMGDFGTPQAYTAFDDILTAHLDLFVRNLAQDGLTAYLQEDPQSAGPIRSARRARTSEAFGPLQAHGELVVERLPIVEPWVSLDGKRLYGFIVATYQLVVVEANDPGFGDAVRVDDSASLQSAVYSSVLRADELVVYSTVNGVRGHQVKGSGGIARGARSGISAKFDEWEYLEPLDGPGWDTPLWISDDECEILVRQESGSGDSYTADIFIARRAM